MFYVVKFSEKYNYYIEDEKNNKDVYLNYFYDNHEDCYIGVILGEVSNNDEICDDEVIELVDTRIFVLLNQVFSCKNINGFYGLTHPNKNLFNTYRGKTNISQLLFAVEKKSFFTSIYNYIYNLYKKVIYNIRTIIFGSNVQLVDRALEIEIKSIEDNRTYVIKIVSQIQIDKMIKANIIKKLYKIYQN